MASKGQRTYYQGHGNHDSRLAALRAAYRGDSGYGSQDWADKLVEGGKYKRTYPKDLQMVWEVNMGCGSVQMRMLASYTARVLRTFHRLSVKCPICGDYIPAGRIWQHVGRKDHQPATSSYPIVQDALPVCP